MSETEERRRRSRSRSRPAASDGAELPPEPPVKPRRRWRARTTGGQQRVSAPPAAASRRASVSIRRAPDVGTARTRRGYRPHPAWVPRPPGVGTARTYRYNALGVRTCARAVVGQASDIRWCHMYMHYLITYSVLSKSTQWFLRSKKARTPPFRLRSRIYCYRYIKQCCENCVVYRVKIAAEGAGRPALTIQTIFAEHFSVIVVENDKKCTNSLRLSVV